MAWGISRPNDVSSADSGLSLSSEAAVSALNDAVIAASLGERLVNDAWGLSTNVTASEYDVLLTSLITAILSIGNDVLRVPPPGKPIPNGSLVSIAGGQGPTDTTTIMISRWKSDGSADVATFGITPLSKVVGEVASASRFRYCAKASRAEREAGLFGHIACAQYGKPDIVHDPDDGTGLTTLRHYGLDKEGQPVRDKEGEIIWHDCRRNLHPTVKPLSLVRWLATLLLPPAECSPRRILVPFAGSGSEMIGALLAGWDEIVGIEIDPGYFAIAKKRIEEAQLQMRMEI